MTTSRSKRRPSESRRLVHGLYAREFLEELAASCERFWNATPARQANRPRQGFASTNDAEARFQMLTKPYHDKVRADIRRLRQLERIAAESM